MNGSIGDHLLIDVHEVGVESLLGAEADAIMETALARLLTSDTTTHSSFTSNI